MASMLRAHLAALTLWTLVCSCSSSPANITGDDVEFLETEFRCEGKSLGAFYADKSTACRMFHVCARGDHDQLLDLRFACLKGQAFDVQAKACDSAENIVCNDTEVLAEDGSSNTISSNGDTNWDLSAARVRRQLVPFFGSNNLPQTGFSCRGRKLGRFYADTEAGCQLFHVCALGESADELLDFQFLCLNGTVFDDTVQRCLPFAESTCNTKVQDIVQSSTTPVPNAENTTTAAAVVVAAALPTRREQNEAEATTSAFLEDEYIDEEFTEEVPLGEDEFFEGEVVEESGVRAKRQSPLHSYDALPETTFSCVGKVPGGYYADVEAGCQMYHVCAPGPVGSHHSLQDFKFLCSNGTIFSQNTRACQTWYTVDCAASPSFFRLNDDLSQFQEEQVTTSQTFPDEFVQEQVQEEQPRPQRPRPQVQQQRPQQQVQQQRPQVQQSRPQVQQVRPQVQQQQARPQVQQQEQPQVQQRRRPRPQVQQRPQVIHEQAFPRDGFLDSQLALLEQTEPVQRLSSQRTRRPVQVPVEPVQEVFQEEQVAFTPQRRRPIRPLLVEESISSVTSAPASAISTLREQEVRQQVHQMAQDQVVSIPEEEGFATTSTFDETLKALVQTQREADARSRALNRQQVVQEEVRAPAPARRRRVRPSPQNLEEPQQQPQRPVEIHRVQQLDIVRDNVRDNTRDTFAPQRFEIEQEQRVEPARREPHRAAVQRQERPRPQQDPNFDNFASQVQALFTQSPQSPRQVSQQVSHQATRTPVSFVPSFSSLPSFPISPASTLSVDQLPNLNDLPLFLPQPQQRQQQRTSSINSGRQQLQFILQPISSGTQSFQPTPVRFQSSGAGRGRGADDGHVIVLHRGLVVEGSQGNDQLARFAGGAQTGGSGFEFGTGVPQNLRFRRETSHDANRQMRIIRAVPVAADFPKTTFSCQDKVPGRFYADAETNCQVFHLCVNRLSSQSFMCRNGTVFDQRSQACDDQTDALNCVDDPQHYGIGEAFGSSIPVIR